MTMTAFVAVETIMLYFNPGSVETVSQVIVEFLRSNRSIPVISRIPTVTFSSVAIEVAEIMCQVAFEEIV